MMVHADSCPLATTPARFEVLPSALAVIVGGETDNPPALVTVPHKGGTESAAESEPPVAAVPPAEPANPEAGAQAAPGAARAEASAAHV
jgi:hypothetical protein